MTDSHSGQPENEELQPYNPLDLVALGDALHRELEARPLHSLTDEVDFPGVGAYAIYTKSSLYMQAASEAGRDVLNGILVYGGKAVPTGARKGISTFYEPSSQNKLALRLRDHARSIDAAENLDLEDFAFRFLVTAPVWIKLAETILITRHHPVWNELIDGFGNHDPGSGRRQQQRSRWDVIHPGRTWADLLAEPSDPAYTEDSLKEELRDHFQALGKDDEGGRLRMEDLDEAAVEEE